MRRPNPAKAFRVPSLQLLLYFLVGEDRSHGALAVIHLMAQLAGRYLCAGGGQCLLKLLRAIALLCHILADHGLGAGHVHIGPVAGLWTPRSLILLFAYRVMATKALRSFFGGF